MSPLTVRVPPVESDLGRGEKERNRSPILRWDFGGQSRDQVLPFLLQEHDTFTGGGLGGGASN